MPQKMHNKAVKLIAEIGVPYEQIEAFCRRWRVSEMALFGSAVRDDFSNDSDIDILVSFAPDASWSLFDLVAMKSELETVFAREVDLVEREALQNPFRRKSIFGG